MSVSSPSRRTRSPGRAGLARRIAAAAASAVLLVSLLPAVTAASSSGSEAGDAHFHKVGTTVIVATGTAPAGTGSLSASSERSPAADVLERSPRSTVAAGGQVRIPVPSSIGVDSRRGDVSGFVGLSHVDSRTASGGNQFSLEPPDQGLCVGNGHVVETVNDVMAVYDTRGRIQSGPMALNAFYRYAYAIDRTSGTFGPFVTDPKCLYDAATNRFYMTVLTLDTDPATGDPIGTTHVDIAVSQGGDPTGAWTIFSFSTTNGDGTLAGHPGCPCLGDQPLLGADAHGIYISTNEFPVFSAGFNGAQLYAVSKSLLAEAATGAVGTLPTLVAINLGSIATPDINGTWYSVQPATSPGGDSGGSGGSGDSRDSSSGTEYFLSALDFFGAGDQRIAAWALTNTASLDSGTPAVTMQAPAVLQSEPYGSPVAFGVTQRPGPTPLGTALGEGLEQLNANDDRMNQVVYANGQLWSALNTAVGDGTRSAIAYFTVTPKWRHGSFAPRLSGQGYVSVANNSVLFPSVGVTPDGRATVAFTLVGPDYFPSAAYASLRRGSAGPVRIVASGAAPEDGFTGYAAFGGDGIARWGDYSAAVTDTQGNVWMAAEYIPGGTRTLLANWGTFISRVSD